MKTIKLYYSPDSDDAFMFWALKKGYVPSGDYVFEHHQADTEALNQLAALSAKNKGFEAPDVCAVSLHQYAYLTQDYMLLPHGASVGRGYGPVVVSNAPMDLEMLKKCVIAVPGMRTTAYLVLRLLIGNFQAKIVPITPFSKVFDALKKGDVDAALLIHEGRLLFDSYNTHCILDIGEAWLRKTGMPLPLGVNVINRQLGQAHMAAVSKLLGESIAWAMTNKHQVIDEMLAEQTREALTLSRQNLERYLDMYANRDTAAFAQDVLRAIDHLFSEAVKHDLIHAQVKVELAP